eukprot:1477387-Amphidinium_carterae.1
MEYQIPGTDVRTSIVRKKCIIAAFIANFCWVEQRTTECALRSRTTTQCCILLEPTGTLRSERTLQTTCKSSSFHDASIR